MARFGNWYVFVLLVALFPRGEHLGKGRVNGVNYIAAGDKIAGPFTVPCLVNPPSP
jgi:hypothetical protein